MRYMPVVAALSIAVLFVSIMPVSFGDDYDRLSEWGGFGVANPGVFSHPQHVAVDDDGSVYVTDYGNKRVQKFTSTGEFVIEWGQNGKHDGQFYYPSGIAVYDDMVFVADRDLNRIQKFTTDGEFVMEWGARGAAPGQMLFPNGIAIHDGIIYVAETGNQRIQAFTTDGEFVRMFGSSGFAPGELLTPLGIDTDSHGNVYVADKGNHRISVFYPDGTFAESIDFNAPGFAFLPETILLDPEDRMFIANSASGLVLYLPRDAEAPLSVFEKIGPYRTSFGAVTDMALGINGELLIVDSSNHMVRVFETPLYMKPHVDPDVVGTGLVEYEAGLLIYVPQAVRVEATDYYTKVGIGEARAIDESDTVGNSKVVSIYNDAPEYFLPGVTDVVWTAFGHDGTITNDTQTITVTACSLSPDSYNLIMGTETDDVIRGTNMDDLIFGLGGSDLIFGMQGNDCIYGGAGDDAIFGNAGSDTIKGNLGDDVLRGGPGDDEVYARTGYDIVEGGDGVDRCYVPGYRNDIVLLGCE